MILELSLAGKYVVRVAYPHCTIATRTLTRKKYLQSRLGYDRDNAWVRSVIRESPGRCKRPSGKCPTTLCPTKFWIQSRGAGVGHHDAQQLRVRRLDHSRIPAVPAVCGKTASMSEVAYIHGCETPNQRERGKENSQKDSCPSSSSCQTVKTALVYLFAKSFASFHRRNHPVRQS